MNKHPLPMDRWIDAFLPAGSAWARLLLGPRAELVAGGLDILGSCGSLFTAALLPSFPERHRTSRPMAPHGTSALEEDHEKES